MREEFTIVVCTKGIHGLDDMIVFDLCFRAESDRVFVGEIAADFFCTGAKRFHVVGSAPDT